MLLKTLHDIRQEVVGPRALIALWDEEGGHVVHKPVSPEVAHAIASDGVFVDHVDWCPARNCFEDGEAAEGFVDDHVRRLVVDKHACEQIDSHEALESFHDPVRLSHLVAVLPPLLVEFLVGNAAVLESASFGDFQAFDVDTIEVRASKVVVEDLKILRREVSRFKNLVFVPASRACRGEVFATFGHDVFDETEALLVGRGPYEDVETGREVQWLQPASC